MASERTGALDLDHPESESFRFEMVLDALCGRVGL